MKEEQINELLNIFDYSFRISNGRLQKNVNIISNKKELVLPESIGGSPLKVIGKGSFAGNNIDRVILSNGLEIIEEHAFNGNKLTEIFIPRTVKRIGYYSFAHNPIHTIYAPPSLEHWDITAFEFIDHPTTVVCIEGSYAHKRALEDSNIDRVSLMSEMEFYACYVEHKARGV